MLTWTDYSDADRERSISLVVMLITEAGGNADPARFYRRPEGSPAREAFGECVKRGYVTAEGRLTGVGADRRAMDLVRRDEDLTSRAEDRNER